VTSIALNFDEMEQHNYKLQEKYRRIKENEAAWDGYKLDDAKVVLVSYGISSRIARSAVDAARKMGIKAGLFRPITLFPFPEKEIRRLADKGCKFISVEMSNGQMREDIRLYSGCQPVELVCRYGGNLIQLDDIVKKIKEVA
jgi:2-oxoisovalerate ferredoxin oxidoreductase alpha subunit